MHFARFKYEHEAIFTYPSPNTKLTVVQLPFWIWWKFFEPLEFSVW